MILTAHPYDPFCTTPVLGFWRSPPGTPLSEPAHFPDPVDYVDRDWDPGERIAVGAYLDEPPFVQAYRGSSLCRICGKALGFRERGDGRFTWPEGFSHYVFLHAVRPPETFLEHVRAQLAR